VPDAVLREHDDGRVTGLADSEVDVLANAASGVAVG
jgi:hypothetical protein